jgi:hypothetical protein
MSTDPVKSILKRKREYLSRLEQEIALAKAKNAEAKKRAREEYPSDDESLLPQPQQKQQKGSQSKQRRKIARRKSIEEEIVTPKLSTWGTFPRNTEFDSSDI